MSWFSTLFSGGASEVVERVGDVIDEFHLSGEEKQKFKLQLRQVVAARESEVEQTIRKNLEAKERILVAELAQGDAYTKRARPTVVYFGLVMIGLNYFVVPLVGLLSGSDPIPFELPTQFWAAWGGIVATWAVGRSFEKAGAGNKITNKITGNKRVSLLEDDSAAG
ncbi:MAG: hypothetical protein Alis3KO_33760 [Aliiglaciecola sp.]|uniref:3TM-type holin n=1 Tax=Aliiglaciecola sp. M165 TaxID=2593649 RepID=UPI00163DDFA0|nr:3TM-type holin [Aliiglaciecola sp. M165]